MNQIHNGKTLTEIKEARELRLALRIERGNILAEYVQFLPPMGYLGIMNETEFERLLSIAKSQKQQHEAKLAQDEIERLERKV